MLGNHGRGLTKALFTRPALALGRLGVTPDLLTVTGTILSVTAAVTLLPRGHFVVGPLVLLVVLVADSFDGILARATARSSVFGAFLDSTMDRLADGAVLGSLAAWAALSMPAGTLRTTTIVAALAAMILAATVPYARARAESIGANACGPSTARPSGQENPHEDATAHGLRRLPPGLARYSPPARPGGLRPGAYRRGRSVGLVPSAALHHRCRTA